jgi:hypothetical protein
MRIPRRPRLLLPPEKTGQKNTAKRCVPLANRLAGILHGSLRHRHPYDESVAWPCFSGRQLDNWAMTYLPRPIGTL